MAFVEFGSRARPAQREAQLVVLTGGFPNPARLLLQLLAFDPRLNSRL